MLVNGVIIAPQKHYVVVGTQQVGGFKVPRFEELPPAVLIDEYTDTIYDASADVFVRGHPPLPDTMLARNQTIFKSLPVSAPTPPALAATADRRAGPVAHAADAAGHTKHLPGPGDRSSCRRSPRCPTRRACRTRASTASHSVATAVTLPTTGSPSTCSTVT